jgi:hypothetical protein
MLINDDPAMCFHAQCIFIYKVTSDYEDEFFREKMILTNKN